MTDARRFNSGVTSVAQWDDLLRGRSSRTSTTEPAREARTAPLPDELDPRVRDALAASASTSSTRTRREAWDAARARRAT